jgi:O-methyltransferase involved in polyketide biosynthesis
VLYLPCGLGYSPSGFQRKLHLSVLIEKCFSLINRIYKWVSNSIRKKEMGFNKENSNSPRIYENIGPTAALVSYYRSFSDIPFARQVSDIIQAKEIAKNLIVNDDAHLARMLVAFEARFKSVDSVLKKYPHINRFIEIPAGFSTRGMAMTADNSGIKYVECDLPAILREKQKLVVELFSSTNKSEKPDLRFCPASILDFDQLRLAASNLGEEPIAVITEGLFSYLTPQEKAVAAKNIHALLKERKGVWIVTDLTRIFKPNDSKATELRERISTQTGFSPITGCFASVSEAKKFFEHFGFTVRDYRRSEVIASLSTTKTSMLKEREIEKLLEPQATFALEVR